VVSNCGIEIPQYTVPWFIVAPLMTGLENENCKVISSLNMKHKANLIWVNIVVL
jgi:hypothetical protein